MRRSLEIEQSKLAVIVTDPRQDDNPIIACNAAFLALTGYSRAEVIGRNCRLLAGPDTEADRTEKLRAAIRAREPCVVELLNYRKDRNPFRNAVMLAPLFDENGELEYFLGSQVEVGGEGASVAEAARRRLGGLSSRQYEILLKMAAGARGKQIAHSLGITVRTVKMHRAAIYRALGVTSGAEAIRIAIEAGH